MNDYIIVTSILAFSVFTSLLIAWAVLELILSVKRFLDQRDFRRKLVQRIEIGSIDMDMVRLFGKSPLLSHANMEYVIANLLSEYLVSTDDHVRKKSRNLKKLHDKIKAEQPYQEIPEKLRLPLEKLRAKLGVDADEFLTPLVRELFEFSDKKQRQERWAKIIGFGGALASIVGLAAAFWFQFL